MALDKRWKTAPTDPRLQTAVTDPRLKAFSSYAPTVRQTPDGRWKTAPTDPRLQTAVTDARLKVFSSRAATVRRPPTLPVEAVPEGVDSANPLTGRKPFASACIKVCAFAPTGPCEVFRNIGLTPNEYGRYETEGSGGQRKRDSRVGAIIDVRDVNGDLQAAVDALGPAGDMVWPPLRSSSFLTKGGGLQEAIGRTRAAGGVVSLPACSTAVIFDPPLLVPPGVTIRGAGRSSKIRIAPGARATSAIRVTGNGEPGAPGVQLLSFSLESEPDAPETYGIEAEDATTPLLVADVTVAGWGVGLSAARNAALTVIRDSIFWQNSVGLILYGTNQVIITSSRFTDCSTGALLFDARLTDIHSCHFERNRRLALGLDGSTGTTVCENCFSGNAYEAAPEPVQTLIANSAHGTLLMGNDFDAFERAIPALKLYGAKGVVMVNNSSTRNRADHDVFAALESWIVSFGNSFPQGTRPDPLDPASGVCDNQA